MKAADWIRRNLDIHPVVFPASVAIIVSFVLVGAIAPTWLGGRFGTLQGALVEHFGWFYILSMTGFLIFVLSLVFSRHGAIRLGPDDSRPDFSTPTWFAMLFSAGMGIGLMFFSVAEPVWHFDSPPPNRSVAEIDRARSSVAITFFHWGLHPWACYAVVGLALAYFGFRRGLPISIRSAFYPLLGHRIHGPIGHVIDTLAVVSTLFGVATSLGLGAIQVNAGLNAAFGVPEGATMQVVIITVITLIATVSVVTGLAVGVRRLSELNMVLAGLLLLFVFLLGPTLYLLNAIVQNLGTYLQFLPFNSFWTATFDRDSREWLSSWTVFYWAWWIAWSPFVGMFIARISKGRTIREFILAVLLVAPLTTFIWLTIFGNTGLNLQMLFAAGMEGGADLASEPLERRLFAMLDTLPLAIITGAVATACIVLFFVTSSDSASLVIDTIASGGKRNAHVSQRVFWALAEGMVAAVLLVAGAAAARAASNGEVAPDAGLQALQTGAITTALPFCIVLVIMCYSILRGLRDEPIEIKAQPDHAINRYATEDAFGERKSGE